MLATTIIGCFFAPWSGSLSASALRQIDSVGTVLWLIPVLALATLLALRNLPLRQRLGTTTAISAWVGVFFFFFKAVLITGAALSWGASLTLVASLGLFVLSGERRYILPMDLVAKRLNSRKAEVYSHWGTLTPGARVAILPSGRTTRISANGMALPIESGWASTSDGSR